MIPKSPRLDGQAIVASLADQAERIARRVLGEPKKARGHALHYGRNQGSLIVTIQGPSRGLWYDHSTGEGGTLLHLIAKQHGLTLPNDYHAVLQQALHFLGQDPRYFQANNSSIVQPEKANPLPDYDTHNLTTWTDEQKKRIGYAQKLEKQSKPIRGTLAEKYLRHYRGIQLDQWPKNLRFHPGLKSGFTECDYEIIHSDQIIDAKIQREITLGEKLLFHTRNGETYTVYGRDKFGQYISSIITETAHNRAIHALFQTKQSHCNGIVTITDPAQHGEMREIAEVYGISRHQTRRALPALLGIYRNDKGNIRAVQAIFLDPDTAQKVNPEKQPHLASLNKQTFGVVKQGACNFIQRAVYREKSYLAEGIETGLTILMANPTAKVHVSLGLSGLPHIAPNLLSKQTVICLDNDGKPLSAQPAIHRTVENLLQENKQVGLVMPPMKGTDYNDLLRQSGIDDVKENIQQEYPITSLSELEAGVHLPQSEAVDSPHVSSSKESVTLTPDKLAHKSQHDRENIETTMPGKNYEEKEIER